MSNRGGGDASLTARIQILNEGLENLQKTMQQLQQLRVEFLNSENQMKSFEAARKSVGSSGSDAISAFVASATGAKNSLGALNSTISQASSAVRIFGRDTTQGAQGATQLKSMLDQANTSAKNLGTSVQTLGSGLTSSIAAYSAAAVSVFGLYNAFDNLEKVQQRADRSALAAQTAQTRLASLQENYNEQLAKGNLTAEEVSVQQQKIADAQERVTVSNQQAQIAAGDLNETMAGLALQTLPFVATAAVNVIQMITTMRAAFASQTVVTGALTTANLGLAASFRVMLMANLPLFAAITAGAAIVGAFAANLFGLRDAINGIGVAIGNALPFLKPFLDFLGGINAIFGNTSDSVDKSVTDISGSIGEMKTSAIASFGEVGVGIKKMQTTISQESKAIIDNITNMQSALKTPNFEVDSTRAAVTLKETITSRLTELMGEDLNIPVGFSLDEGSTEEFQAFIDRVKESMNDPGQNQLAANISEAEKRLIALTKTGSGAGLTLSDLKDRAGELGDVVNIAGGKAQLTDKQFEILAERLGLGADKVDELKVALAPLLETFGKSQDIVVIGDRIIDLTKNADELDKEVAKLGTTFDTSLNTIVNGSADLGTYKQHLVDIQNEIAKFGQGTKQQADATKNLSESTGRHITDSLLHMGEFRIGVDQVLAQGEDVAEYGNYWRIGLDNVKKILGDTGTELDEHADIIQKFFDSNKISVEDQNKFWLSAMSGQAVAMEGMSATAEKSVGRVNEIMKQLGLSREDAVLLEAAIALLSERFASFDGEKMGASLQTIMDHANEFATINKEVSAVVDSEWSKVRESLYAMTDPQPIIDFIAYLEEMKNTEGISQADIAVIENYQKKLQGVVGTINNTRDAQLEETQALIAHAEAVGVSSSTLSELRQIKEDNIQLSYDQMAAYQEEINMINEFNALGVTQEEMLYRQLQGRGQALESIGQMILSANEELGVQQALEESVLKVAEAYGLTWPEGMAGTIENLQMVYGASIGLKDAQDELHEATVELAGGLTAQQQAEVDLTNSIIENARASGVSADVLTRYNTLRDKAGALESRHQASLLNAARAARTATGDINRLGLTQLQASNATLTGQVRFDAFARTVQVEAAESRAYAYALAQALIQLGMSAAKAYAMVSQSIAAGEQAYKFLKTGIGSMPDMSSKKFGGGGGGGGGGSKQKITKEEKEDMREQAIQDAIKEESAVNSLVKSLIDETSAIHKLGLESGISRKEMEQFQKATNEFGIATEKARIEMLLLVEAQSKQLKFLTDSTAIYKDYIRANIEGIQKANDFTREVRSNVRSLESQREQLFQITRALGITLPSALRPTVKNLQDLIAASYGSEEAMEALRKSALSATDFYRKTIADAKKAITDAKFEEFVKKELLFENLGDEFFRNVSRELQAEMKLDSISEQLQKQLGLIQLNPKMFEMNVSEAELRNGVQNTITMIEDQIRGSERLTAAWQPILDQLYATLNAPDAHEAIQGFAQMFPDLIEPAVLGVTEAMKGVDTQIDTTFDDTSKENAIEYAQTVEDLRDKTEELYDELLKLAKAANEASGGGGGGGGGGIGGLGDSLNEIGPAADQAVTGMVKVPQSFHNIRNAALVAIGQIPPEFQKMVASGKMSMQELEAKAVYTSIQTGSTFDKMPARFQQAIARMPPDWRAAMGIIENEAGKSTATIADDFTIIPPAAGGAAMGAVDQYGNKITGIEQATGGAVQNAELAFDPLVEKGGTTGTDTSSEYDKNVQAAVTYTDTLIQKMGQSWYYLVEFLVNTVNPALLRATEEGFAPLPPIVATHVTTMQTNYDVLQTGLPTSTQTSVNAVNLVLDQLPIHMTGVVNIMQVNYTTGMQKIQIQTQTTINDITIRLGTLGPVTTGVVNEMVKQFTTGMAKFPPAAQQAVNAVTNSLGTLVQVTANITSRMAQSFAQLASQAGQHMASLQKAAEKNWDAMAKASEKAAQRATKAVKSIPTYHLTIHEIRTVYTGGGGGAAEGTTQIVSKETHFTAGEGGRPEIVSVVPLVSDAFGANGKADGSLTGLSMSDIANGQKFTENMTPNGGMMANPSAAVSFKSADIGGGGGGSRTINLNINQPIILNDREVGRSIVNQTFTDMDGQT